MIKLESVYRHKDHLRFLYALLAERTPEQSISHKKMPPYPEHEEFVLSKPYQAWYILIEESSGYSVGSIYLSKNREIGISVAPGYQGRGYGKEAVRLLMARWPGRFLANINPKNERSAAFFEGFGFELIQHTYARV